MKAVLPACLFSTLLMLFFLAHMAIGSVKPVEIIHMPRFLFAGQDLGFQVRIRATDDDRQQWVLLCDRSSETPCTVDHNERVSMVTIEGSAAPRLWSPRSWTHMPAGEFMVVAAIGANNQIRVADVLTISVQGM